MKAYYGAWYYIPNVVTNNKLWNLFHFQGADSLGATVHGLWDLSLFNSPDGLNLRVLNFLWPKNSPDHILDAPVAVPIGTWFHIEVFLSRAKDATGELAVYQDGVRVIDFANLITDDTDWGQWFVGNLATDLTPPELTLYVDDVTIAATLGWAPPP